MKAKKTSNGCVVIYCPGCKEHHAINVESPSHRGHQWTFNYDFEKPTFTPSLVIKTGLYVDPNVKGDPKWLRENSSICHSFITNGRIQFLDDCTHELRNQTVDLPDLKRE